MNSLIIPVYKNSDSIDALLSCIAMLNKKLDNSLEAIFVVDGSPDDCAHQLRNKLPAQNFPSTLIVLSRNFGSFSAIRAGLEKAHGKYFAVMAADLQEPPELILDFFKELAHNECDVVIGTREGRDDPFFNKLSAGLFWKIYRKFIVSDMPPGGVDIFGCNLNFRENLLNCKESNTSLIALIFWLGFRRKQISYKRLERTGGVSAWTFMKKVNYLLDSIFAFTDLPIKILLVSGAIGLGFSFLFAIFIVFAKFSGLITMPGYSTTILLVLFFGGLNTAGLGVVGSYAWRGYENTKKRPLVITMNEMNFNQ